jgi:hypothetical protein
VSPARLSLQGGAGPVRGNLREREDGTAFRVTQPHRAPLDAPHDLTATQQRWVPANAPKHPALVSTISPSTVLSP